MVLQVNNIRVIEPSYVNKCITQGYVADEEPYEWYSSESNLGKMARYWRQSRKRPFENWSVKIQVDESKHDGFVRVLSAGRAEIVEIGNDDTICIVDKRFKDMQSNLKKVDTSYVVDYLTSLGKLDIRKYLV